MCCPPSKINLAYLFRYIKRSQHARRHNAVGRRCFPMRFPRLLLSRSARSLKSITFALVVNGSPCIFCGAFFSESFRASVLSKPRATFIQQRNIWRLSFECWNLSASLFKMHLVKYVQVGLSTGSKKWRVVCIVKSNLKSPALA